MTLDEFIKQKYPKMSEAATGADGAYAVMLRTNVTLDGQNLVKVRPVVTGFTTAADVKQFIGLILGEAQDAGRINDAVHASRTLVSMVQKTTGHPVKVRAEYFAAKVTPVAGSEFVAYDSELDTDGPVFAG